MDYIAKFKKTRNMDRAQLEAVRRRKSN